MNTKRQYLPSPDVATLNSLLHIKINPSIWRSLLSIKVETIQVFDFNFIENKKSTLGPTCIQRTTVGTSVLDEDRELTEAMPLVGTREVR